MHLIPLVPRDTLKRELQRSAWPFSLEFNPAARGGIVRVRSQGNQVHSPKKEINYG